ncbi:MAG: hypothetical protein H7839_01885 [Magnetococcus sp. YQC-5]
MDVLLDGSVISIFDCDKLFYLGGKTNEELFRNLAWLAMAIAENFYLILVSNAEKCAHRLSAVLFQAGLKNFMLA